MLPGNAKNGREQGRVCGHRKGFPGAPLCRRGLRPANRRQGNGTCSRRRRRTGCNPVPVRILQPASALISQRIVQLPCPWIQVVHSVNADAPGRRMMGCIWDLRQLEIASGVFAWYNGHGAGECIRPGIPMAALFRLSRWNRGGQPAHLFQNEMPYNSVRTMG